jgi:sarcosine oxidase subunit beta
LLARNSERQRAAGLTNVRAVSRAEIMAMVPQLRSEDILGGSFCPTDGFVDPHSVMTGFSRRAEVVRDARVTAIEVDSRGVAGVRTTRGDIATRIVVNAAGPWAAEIAALAGVELPVVPLRRMLVPTEPFDQVSHDAPMTIDMSTGFHFRPEGLGFLFAWADPEETAGFRTDFDRAFLEKILAHAVRRVPVFEEVQVNPSRAWAGLYEMTPDHHPILGPGPVPGLYFANGFSGHGVMHSPATGRILADLILKGTTDLIDARLFDYARFREGRLIHETGVL